MRRLCWVEVLASLLMAGLAGCGSGMRGAPRPSGPVLVQSVPPVPEKIAAQRVRYISSNLLPGDTSFELPAGRYAIGFQGLRTPTSLVRPMGERCRPVTALAVHGRRALRLSRVTSEGTYVVHWPAVRLKRGQTYMFSAYLRGDGGPVTVRLAPCWPTDPGRTKAFRPTDQWRRYHVSFKVPVDEGEGPSVAFTPALLVTSGPRRPPGRGGGDNWVEIDAVQLAAGGSLGPYRPQRPIDYVATVEALAPTGHLRPGQALAIDCAVRNNTAEHVSLQLVWRLSDVLGGRTWLRTLDVSLPPGRRREVKLDFGLANAGYYLLRTDVRGGADLGLTDQLGLAVFGGSAVRRADGGAFFGFAGARGTSGTENAPASVSLPALAALGAGSPQCMVWRWRDLETTPGEDDLEAADRTIDAALAGGAEPVVCLSGAMPHLAPTWAVPVGDADPASPAVDRRQYRQFVFRVVAHFRGRVRHWLLPPAPPKQRPAWARLFRQSVKLADPRANVVGPGVIPPEASQRPALQAFLGAGGAGELDVLLHSLSGPGPDPLRENWDQLDEDLAGVARACAQVGRADLPRWEMTPAWSWPETMDAAARAGQIHRTALLLKKHGVVRWLIPDPAPSDAAMRSGFPVEFAACATMTGWLGAARFALERPIGSGLSAMVFEGPTGPFAALVRTKPSAPARPISVSIPAGLRVENLFGRLLADGTSPMNLMLSSAPVYVRPVARRANWLDGIVVSPAPRKR